jgi:hypothetical protein
MNRERMDANLDRALRALAGETRDATPPPRVKGALLRAVRARRRQTSWWWRSAAAVLLIGAGVLAARWIGTSSEVPPADVAAQLTPAPEPPALLLDVPPAPRPRSRPRPRPQRWSDIATVRPVTNWYYSAGLPLTESGQVIRLEVPATTAARFGIAASGPVQADLYVGDDGLTRAIRFVQ